MSGTLQPCRCGGTGVVVAGHYPDWREAHCDTCGRIEFGRDESSVIARWNVLLSPGHPSEAARRATGETASDHANLGKETQT